MRGIPQVRQFDLVKDAVIVRPILSCPKSDVLEYCRAHKIEYVTDSTNFESDCTRNAIRNRIIPELERLFNTPQKNAWRLAVSAKEDADRLMHEAEEFLSGRDRINVADLLSLSPSISKRALKLAFARVSDRALEAVHVEDILHLAHIAKDGFVSLPDKKRAVTERGELFFEDDEPHEAPEHFCVGLGEGYTRVNELFTVCVAKCPPSDEYVDGSGNIYKLYTSARFKNVKIEELFARGRLAGDHIRAGGMSKKVKKLLCDGKTNTRERDLIPMICSGDELIFVPPLTVADAVRADKQNSEYVISIYKIN